MQCSKIARRMRYCYHARTNPGLQEVLGAELRDLTGPDPRIEIRESPDGVRDAVHLTSPRPIGWEAFAAVRCAYEITEIRSAAVHPNLQASSRIEALRIVRDRGESTDFPELDADTPFAVRCIRRGAHALKSADVEREIGAILVARTGAPVDLTSPDLTVRVYLYGDVLYCGLLMNPYPMDRRFEWLYRPRVALNPVVAAALLRYASTDAPDAGSVHRAVASRHGGILDPFCGSGTIPLEAAHTPALSQRRIYASDIMSEAIAGTRANLAIHARLHRVQTRLADATRLASIYAGYDIDTIVCDPPFGVRSGRGLDFASLYGALLDNAAAILPPGGRLVLMSSKRRGRLNRVIAGRTEWSILHVRIIEIGGIFPGIFVLRYR